MPVVRQSSSQLIPSGKKEELIRRKKIEAGNNIREINGADIVKEIAALAPAKNASALDLLDEAKEALAGCFVPESLQAFRGLVNLTYYAGKISYFDFTGYQNWLKNVQKTVENESIIHDVHEREYSGFAYVDKEGKIKYYYNAVKASTFQRQSELRKAKLLVTPLFTKRYCFNKVDELSVVIEKFKERLKIVFDENFLHILQYMYYDLPSALDKEKFQQSYRDAEDKDKKMLLEALSYYGTLWQAW